MSPNTSQYRYYRSNKLVRSPSGYLGEDIHVRYDLIHLGRVREECDKIWRNGIFAQQADVDVAQQPVTRVAALVANIVCQSCAASCDGNQLAIARLPGKQR